MALRLCPIFVFDVRVKRIPAKDPAAGLGRRVDLRHAEFCHPVSGPGVQIDDLTAPKTRDTSRDIREAKAVSLRPDQEIYNHVLVVSPARAQPEGKEPSNKHLIVFSWESLHGARNQGPYGPWFPLLTTLSTVPIDSTLGSKTADMSTVALKFLHPSGMPQPM